MGHQRSRIERDSACDRPRDVHHNSGRPWRCLRSRWNGARQPGRLALCLVPPPSRSLSSASGVSNRGGPSTHFFGGKGGGESERGRRLLSPHFGSRGPGTAVGPGREPRSAGSQTHPHSGAPRDWRGPELRWRSPATRCAAAAAARTGCGRSGARLAALPCSAQSRPALAHMTLPPEDGMSRFAGEAFPPAKESQVAWGR